MLRRALRFKATIIYLCLGWIDYYNMIYGSNWCWEVHLGIYHKLETRDGYRCGTHIYYWSFMLAYCLLGWEFPNKQYYYYHDIISDIDNIGEQYVIIWIDG